MNDPATGAKDAETGETTMVKLRCGDNTNAPELFPHELIALAKDAISGPRSSVPSLAKKTIAVIPSAEEQCGGVS